MRSFHRNVITGILLLMVVLLPMPAFSATSNVGVTVDGSASKCDALVRNNLVFMSARDLAGIFDATYAYHSENKTITLKSGFKTATLQLDSTSMKSGFFHYTLDASPMLIGNECYLPLNVATILWGASYGFNEEMLYIHSDGSEVVVPVIEKYQIETKTVMLDNKPTQVCHVIIPKNSGLNPSLAIAQNVVGETEALESISKRSAARVAINGSYYQRYNVAGAQDPYGILIKNGKLIHSEATGSTVGFTADGTVKMDIVRTNITASVGDKYYSVKMMNHIPAASMDGIVLFTSAHGSSVNAIGTSVVVQNGEITAIHNAKDEAVSIPSNGFVLQFLGSEESAVASLHLKERASYQVSYTNANGNPVDWSDVQTAIGAGPLLLKNGTTVLNPEKEGFLNDSDFSVAINRSAIGVRKDGTILMVSGVKCTLTQLADVMSALGAVNAISMDCGTASGMYVSSGEVSNPTKEVSNALIFK